MRRWRRRGLVTWKRQQRVLVVGEPLALPREELLRQMRDLLFELGDASAQLGRFVDLLAC
jgi:hypothetical protein